METTREKISNFERALRNLTSPVSSKMLIVVKRLSKIDDWLTSRLIKTGGNVLRLPTLDAGTNPSDTKRKVIVYQVKPKHKSFVYTEEGGTTSETIANVLKNKNVNAVSCHDPKMIYQLQANGIDVAAYVPSEIHYVSHFADDGDRYVLRSESGYASVRNAFRSWCTNKVRMYSYTPERHLLGSGFITSDYWKIFHLNGITSTNDVNIVATDYFEPTLFTNFRRLGFTIISERGLGLEDDSHVILEPDLIEGLYRMNNYSAAHIPAAGKYLKSTDLKYLDDYRTTAVEREFGKLLRHSIFTFANTQLLSLDLLGSEMETIVLEDYYTEVMTKHFVHASLENEVRDYNYGDLPANIVLTYDFMDELDKLQSDVVIGLFSVSNSRNMKPKDLVREFVSRDKSFIFSFPNDKTLNNWDGRMSNFSFKDGIMNQKVGNDNFKDWAVSPEVFLDMDVIVLSAHDMLAVLQSDSFGNYTPAGDWIAASMNDPLFNLWYFVCSTDILPHRIQSWINSQTHFARYTSIPLRNILGAKENSLHAIRSAVLTYVMPSGVGIDDPKITGYYVKNGKRIYVSVSGHLINLLSTSSVTLIDFRRYMDTVEMNVRAYSGAKMTKEERFMIENHLLAEDNLKTTFNNLWHSYDDFYIAVATYITMQMLMKLPLNLRAVRYILQRLIRIRNIYPSFSDECEDVKIYKQSGRTWKI